MKAIDIDQCFGKALHSYQSAKTREDYNATLAELTTILRESHDLSPLVRRNCLLLSAKCLQSLDRVEEAVQSLQDLLNEIEVEPSIEDLGFRAAVKLSLAEGFKSIGKWNEAIDLFSDVTKYFQQNGDWQSEVNIYRTIALLYQNHNKMDKAIAFLEAARPILDKYTETPIHQEILFALGHCHYISGNVGTAIALEERALALARRFGDTQTENQLIHNLAEFTFNVQDFRRALHYISKRLKIAQDSEDSDSIIRYLLHLSACYTETGQSNEALKIYDKVEKLLLNQDQQASLVHGMCLLGKAQVFIDVGGHDYSPLKLN